MTGENKTGAIENTPKGKPGKPVQAQALCAQYFSLQKWDKILLSLLHKIAIKCFDFSGFLVFFMACLCKCPQLNTKFNTNAINLFPRYFRTFRTSLALTGWSQLSTLVSPPPWGFLWLLSSMSINILQLSLSGFLSLVGEFSPWTPHHFTEGTCFLLSPGLAEMGLHDFLVPLHWGPQWQQLTHPCSDFDPRRFLPCFCKPCPAVKATSVFGISKCLVVERFFRSSCSYDCPIYIVLKSRDNE